MCCRRRLFLCAHSHLWCTASLGFNNRRTYFCFYDQTLLAVCNHHGGRYPPPVHRLRPTLLFSGCGLLAPGRARARRRRFRLLGKGARDHAGEILRTMVTEQRRSRVLFCSPSLYPTPSSSSRPFIHVLAFHLSSPSGVATVRN